MSNKKAKGKRANTRSVFRGEKLTVEKMLKEYNTGDRVVIKPNGAYHSGLPDRRASGHIGQIKEKIGRATYTVYVKDLNKEYKVGNVHLKSV